MKRDDYLTIKSLNYPVHIGDKLWGPVADFIKPYFEKEKVFLLTDHNTEKYCLPLFREKTGANDTPHFSVNPGENSKDLRTVELIWLWLMENGADRDSMLVNLGGGVISDLGGFAAATFKRGMKFINIPTSLIGQADAAVGGKTGINYAGVKNQAGIFANPQEVFIIPEFLATLPEEHIRSGFAEIVKCALLAGDGFWSNVKSTGMKGWKEMESLIIETVKFKSHVVAKDPVDLSYRRILNFGHTVGHALESFSNKPGGPGILHGDAVAAGLICAAFISADIAGLSNNKRDEIVTFIRLWFPFRIIEEKYFDEILSLMDHDKKTIGQGMNFSLLRAIGEPVYDRLTEREIVIRSLNYLNQISRP